MTQSVAKILLRVIGTLAGLLGALMLVVTPFMFLRVYAGKSIAVVLLGLFPFVVAGYFLFAAYLVWFRFSPRAVRHICGTFGFFLLMFATRFVTTPPAPVAPASAPLGAIAFLSFMIAVYFGYRIASRYLIRLLFPVVSSDVQV
jgi:hypothetical protein